VKVPSFVHFQTRHSSTFSSSTCLNRLQPSYKGRLMKYHPQIHGLIRVMHAQASWATWARISLHQNAHGSKYTIFLVLKAGIQGPYTTPVGSLMKGFCSSYVLGSRFTVPLIFLSTVSSHVVSTPPMDQWVSISIFCSISISISRFWHTGKTKHLT
jgi:hypothetical protein